MAAADHVDRGDTPDDAAVAARRELGNLSQIQEATRDVWGRRWIGQAAQDIRYAFRIFWRSPGFALVAILSLTLGIGANTALFEVVNAVRLRALPDREPARHGGSAAGQHGCGPRQSSDVELVGDAAYLARDPGAPDGPYRPVRMESCVVQPGAGWRSASIRGTLGERRLLPDTGRAAGCRTALQQ